MSKSVIIKTTKLVLSALAMIAVMIIIFNFSGQDSAASSDVSNSVAEVVLEVLDKEVPPGQSPSSVPIIAGFNIRKLAHIFLYMCLGLTSFMFFASL
ncbi:MAG: VanZ family protein [Candidatus Coproplasma sp.]